MPVNDVWDYAVDPPPTPVTGPRGVGTVWRVLENTNINNFGFDVLWWYSCLRGFEAPLVAQERLSLDFDYCIS